MGLIINPASAGVTSVPLRISSCRDLLVGSDAPRLMIHPDSTGVTSVPLRDGHDDRAPPKHAFVIAASASSLMIDDDGSAP